MADIIISSMPAAEASLSPQQQFTNNVIFDTKHRGICVS